MNGIRTTAFSVFFLAAFASLVLPPSCLAAEEDKAPEAEKKAGDEPKKDFLLEPITLETFKAIKDLPVSPETLAEIQAFAQDKSSSFSFSGEFGPGLSPREKEYQRKFAKYQRDGKYPFKYFASISETKTGKKPEKIVKGKSILILVDSENKIQFNKKLDNLKLCRT